MKLTNKIFGLTFSLLFSMDLHANELSRVIPEQNLQIKALIVGAGACALGVSCMLDVIMNKPLKNLLELQYYRKTKGKNAHIFSCVCLPSCGFTVEEELPHGSRVRRRVCGYILDTTKRPHTWTTKIIYTAMSVALITYGARLLKEQLPIILKRAE